ncbi:MAG: sodium:proton antiporter [Candidatus Competibacteraceae bacterium]|nr:sodium:proton antiporter [Candidatus Competibacteraceae bacterium]
MLDIAALLIALTALFSFINYHLFRLPTTIGVMLISLVLSVSLLGLGEFGYFTVSEQMEALVRSIDFDEVLLHGMLSLLLFAGAMHVDLDQLSRGAWPIGVLATVGVLASTFIVGLGAWGVFRFAGLEVPLIYCLLFGSLISPTDPIAVLGILKRIGAPRSLEIKITGESLFNDGVAVVIFTILLTVAVGGEEIGPLDIGWLFVEEALGGALFGLVLGLLGFAMLKTVDSYHVEVLITLGLVMGGYALATRLHLSGPIAMVVAGLMIGNHGRTLAMSTTTVDHLDTFWEIVDEILNAVLFVLIGFEIVLLTFEGSYFLAAGLMIPLVLLTRLVCVGVPVTVMRRRFGFEFAPYAITVLTWGGLRGGISVALALVLPEGPARDEILVATYVMVLFSVVVQGLTIGPLVRYTLRKSPAEPVTSQEAL